MNMIRKVIENGVEHEISCNLMRIRNNVYNATFALNKGEDYTGTGTHFKYDVDISHLNNRHYVMTDLVFTDSTGEFTKIPIEGVPCVVGGDETGTNYKYKNVDFFHTTEGYEPLIVTINRDRLCVILTDKILERFDDDTVVTVTFKSVPYPFKKKNTVRDMPWLGLLGKNK